MKWFNNLKIKTKIATIVIVMFLSLLVIGGLAYKNCNDLYHDSVVMYENRLLPIKWVNIMRHHLRNNEAAAYEIMLTKDKNHIEKLQKEIQERTATYTELFDNYSKLPTLTQEEKEHLAIYKEAVGDYKKNRDISIKLALQDKNEEAYNHYINHVQKPLNNAQEELKELAIYNENEAKAVKDQNDKDFYSLVKQFVTIFLVAALVSIAIAIYAIKSIVKPLRVIIDNLNEVAKGNLVIRCNINTKEELGQVSRALNNSLDNLQDLIKKVLQSSEDVKNTSENLKENAEKTSEAANSITKSIMETSEGTEVQLSAIDDTLSIIQEVANKIQKVNLNTKNASNLSEQSKEVAIDGGESIKLTISQMMSIEETINNSAQVVIKLEEHSKGITEIVNTIKYIANQTNLLALNANIEAARAGENGKGFSVVANEVRELAQQSQDSVEEIANVIKNIQLEIKKAVHAMEEGIEEVKKGTETVNNAGTSFMEIENSVNNIAEFIRDISLTTEEISNESESAVNSVQEIRNISEKVVEQTQTISAETEEQSAAMEDVASLNEQLNELSIELDDLLNKFTV